MPRTASSQVQSRLNTKARPSANVRAGNLAANTPVLFRLPTIATSPAQDFAVTLSEAAASLPTATLAAISLTAVQPTAEMPAATSAVEPANEVTVTPQAAPQQSWWEHWSSGVVLIVLLIALAAASILAWQGSNKGKSKLLADTKADSDSQSDLSNIAVPKLDTYQIDVPKVEMPVSTKSSVYAEKPESPSAQNDPRSPNTDESDSSLIPNSALSLKIDPPTNNGSNLETKSEPESFATASLNPPVVKTQEPLFNDGELTQSRSGLTAQPASTAVQRNTANSDKPALWDSSKTNVHDTGNPLTLEFSSDNSKSEKSSASVNTGSSDSLGAPAKLISQSTVDSSSLPPAETTLVPKGMQNVAKTVTPEMDQAELFAAYRELKAPTAPAKVDNRYGMASPSNQPQIGLSNATQASMVGYAQQPTQTNSQPTPNTNNYTLQSAQNLAPNAPMSNSATRNAAFGTHQMQSQPSPNAQYSPSQNSAPQNSFLQNAGLQNAGQQYSAQPNQVQTQYSGQPQAGMLNPSSLQLGTGPNQPTTSVQGLQYGGAQVPYNLSPSQAQSFQLPPGPIGGYGTANSQPNNRPNGGAATPNSPNSLTYPSLQ
jgi:hypothetical protein